MSIWRRFNSTLFLKFFEKMYDTLVKNTPTRTGPKSFSPDPTLPENILKNVSRSWTGIGPVQSGRETRVFGLPRRSLPPGESSQVYKPPFSALRAAHPYQNES